MAKSWHRLLYAIFGDEGVDNGVYSPKRDSIRVFKDNESQFGENLSVQRTPIIELNSSYGTSLLRDKKETAGSGSVAAVDGEIVISTGATSSSESILTSAEVGRYVPGYGAEIGVGFRLDSNNLPTGTQDAKWGGISSDRNNGLYYGYDSEGLYIAHLRNSVETKIRQADFNIDKVDGTGKSGFTLDLIKGAICQINFTWYGHGQILFGVLGVINRKQKFIALHEISNEDNDGVSLISPNLQVFAEVKNNNDSDDLTGYLGGRQYSIVGKFIPKFRFTADFRGSVSTSTTVIPLISFRRKSGFGDRSIKLHSFDIIASTENQYVEIRIGGTLANASFGTPTDYTASETALESDTSATAISGGNVIWGQLVVAGNNKNTAQLATQEVELDIPNGDIVTLCVRTITSTGSAISSFKLREQW